MTIKNSYKYLSYFLLLILMISFFSCTKKEIKQPDNSLQTIKKRGKLIAITGYNAYSYFIYHGRTMGFEYELLKEFSKRIGVDVELKVMKNLDEMFHSLEEKNGDLIAFNLTITNDRKKKFDFTHYINITKQVLVQRKPKNWRRLTLDQINDSLIKTPLDLDNKTVYIRKGSVYLKRLKNLSDENGININIVVADDSLSIEDLIEKVADGKIDYTISDENIAKLNLEYYSNIDASTAVSFPQKIAWAVNKNSQELLDELNKWLDEFKKTMAFRVIYERYFEHKLYYKNRRQSKYLLKAGGDISQYDKIIKENAKEINWDWRLVAALIYQESKFDSEVKSWAGAIGLMQLLPETGTAFGADDLLNPKENIETGIKYLSWLDDYWKDKIKDKNERIKFVLASYNLGFGHIEDARKLAKKYGKNENIWNNNVESILLKKSNPKYFNDKVVKNGYCLCLETIKFVKEILQRYQRYKQFIN